MTDKTIIIASGRMSGIRYLKQQLARSESLRKELEEKLTAEEMKNFKLREKLSIAKEELWKISDAFYRGTTLSELCYIAKQALQKIKEVKTNRCETCKHHYTDYDCLHDYCNVNDKEISINDSCEKWEK